MNILLVEDEPKMATMIARCLTEEGHRVGISGNGREAVERLSVVPIDAAILDVMLPGANGFTVCKAVRELQPRAGVIMLSAKGELSDRIEGLAAGADDYLAKPFALAELLLRLQALERRLLAPPRQESAAKGWHLDLLRQELTVGEHALSLSPREVALMHVFLSHRGEILTRARLVEEAWNLSFDPGTNQIDVYVMYLRRKLGSIGWDHAIETERGLGYRFWEPPYAKDRI